MVLSIANVDMTPYIKSGGIVKGVVKRNTKDRVAISGKLYRSSVHKTTLRISFDPLSESDLKKVIQLIDTDLVLVRYEDTKLGVTTKSFIPDVEDTTLVLEDANGVTYWSGLEVHLEEQ